MPELATDALQASAAPRRDERPAWRSPAGLVSLSISGALLIGLYRSIDLRLVGETLRVAHRGWLVVSVGMIVPITVMRALRFLWVAPRGTVQGVGEATRLTLVAAALNTFAPAKAGDLVKSYFVAKAGGAAGVALAIIAYERLCDLFGLMFWGLVGWLVARPLAAGLSMTIWPLIGAATVVCAILIFSKRAADLWLAVMTGVLAHPKLRGLRNLAEGWPKLLGGLGSRRGAIPAFSLFLWLVHLVQMWMFTVALSVEMPFTVCASLSAIALMIGQLPFTVAGLGARDVALVVLLAGYMRPEEAAAMGILISTRGLLPTLAALPIMRPYLAVVAREARVWRAETERRIR